MAAEPAARLRVKAAHHPVRDARGTIRLGGSVPGLTTGISDPDGWIWHLLSELDGRRPVADVVAAVAARFPARGADDVLAAVLDLADAGFLEAVADRSPLSPAERERHDRGIALLAWMDRTSRVPETVQVLLRDARVTVVGVGGVGSSAALALCASGVGAVHCVDGDVVELSNLNRQVLYTESDLGRPKVAAAVARLRAHNSDVEVTGEVYRVRDAAQVRRIAADCDVVVLAADEPASIREWTNRAGLATGTPWVHAGYHGPMVVVGAYRPGSGPCYECGLTANAPRREPLPGVSAPPNPANAITAAMSGNLAAHLAISLLTGVPAVPLNRAYHLNLVTLVDHGLGQVVVPRPDCAACGRS
ncbi:HesA/MoeB/ThiF family protein [Actinokineospora terrae]|uniref:Molybdopterin or thiamine biosynthesis adenylyltransferase n=1 Tax=Actinokineospora terrae TaxID=155974 RepID=A0A1H9MUG1_9PSEU|nr:ThiF family adenylyltransferase [Actinokineospora terrae]SER27157.1 Molybdopterin or thiamine biosynthesis adenylyltransferase [Actinokineospora terrae]